MTSNPQLLLPLLKEHWPPNTRLTREEEVFQEQWGLYLGWWFEQDFVWDKYWWFALHKQVHPDYDGVKLFDHYGICIRIPSKQMYDMPYTEPAIVCIGCRRCFVRAGHSYIGTWNGEIPDKTHTFKCFLCGPPLPVGKQCAEPVMFRRWKDSSTVILGEPDGALQIVHATYGGVKCPERDVTVKMSRIVQLQQKNLNHMGYIYCPHGIREWIGDPEVGVDKTLRVWFTLRTHDERVCDERKHWAIRMLQRWWCKIYYAPGGVGADYAAQQFERLCQ